MNSRQSGAGVDFGLLVIRLGVGAMFMVFGWGKLQGGPTMWENVGGAMKTVGITAWPVFWGFMAMAAELLGGAMLFLGLLVRPFAALMCFTMVMATVMLISNGKPMMDYAHALDMAIVFLGLVFAGGGRFALGTQVNGLHDKWFR